MVLPKPAAVFLERLLPHPRLAGPRTLARAPRRVIVLGRFPNPSFDYYLSARLAATGLPVHLQDVRRAPSSVLDSDTFAQDAFVLICRYVTPPFLTWIEAKRDILSGVGLFLDDNMAAGFLNPQMPWGSRRRYWREGLSPLPRLNQHLDVVWVSTKALVRLYADAAPVLLTPAPAPSLWQQEGQDAPHRVSQTVTLAYHATGLHIAEHHFLKPIIRAVLHHKPQARFEVFAGKKTLALWTGEERVHVRPTVSWETYLQESLARRVDILLAPLAACRVNLFRSGTKRIDVARLGAAGVFSASNAYGPPDDSGEIRLPHDKDVWEKTLLDLIDDPDARQRAALATRSIVQSWDPKHAPPLFPF